MNLEEYRDVIVQLAKDKGWSNDENWLEKSLFKECGELVEAIEKNYGADAVVDEFADIIHFLLQIMANQTSELNLDAGLQNKIKSNRENKKKTWENGKIVRR